MLLDQSECGKLSPENRGPCLHKSNFSGCDWFLFFIFLTSLFDTDDCCETIQLGGNAVAVSVENVNTFELHYVRINSVGQLLSNHEAILSVSATYASKTSK